MGDVRSTEQLANVDESAWPQVVSWVRSGGVARVLARDAERANTTLFRLQVTTRSTLGALAYGCGGVVVDHGWLRILGGGTGDLVDLATASGLDDPRPGQQPPGHLVVAQDVLGGHFAVNGGELPADPGEIAYWGPDTLDWTALGVGHTDFVRWALTGGTTDFYRDLRWSTWREDAARLRLDHGLSLYPPPSTVEGRDRDRASRRAVPMAELLAFNRQLATTSSDGGTFELRTSD